MLDIALLGPIAVRNASGDDLTPAGARERAAVALLAINAPSTVSTERLAYELYGDGGGSDPRNAVQAVISRLRRSLGRSAGSLETHGAGYRLVDVRLDIDDAEARLADCRSMTGEALMEQLDSVLGLWYGETLSELPVCESLDAERVRVEELRASAQDARLELRCASDSDDPTLIADLEAATRDDATREGRWALLMRAQYRAGRQADALRSFQRAREVMGERLGLEPGPGLVALEQQILNHHEGLATPLLVQEVERALPSGTVSLLLCDVVGSVRRWEAAPEATADYIATLHEIWSRSVSRNGGVLVKSTGDGVLAVFTTAADAVAAAVDGQRDHQASPVLEVKVAVNTGPITPVDGDYRGPLVNRCARLLELAAGGQILVTGTTAALAKEGLGTDSDISLRSLGSRWLRDVTEPVDVAQVNAPGIASTFPVVESFGPSGLPRLRTEVLGREELCDSLVDQAGAHSLVTLLGPGGIGKTTLALAAAWKLAATRNIVFVDLAAMTDESAVARRVADAVSHAGDRGPAQRLSDRLRRNADVVVLDNAEHVIDAVAELVDEVLLNELKGSFIVTSRQPLALAGEQVVSVPPLSLPADDDDLVATAATPAVALFLDRVRRAKPDASVSSGLLPAVAHICRRLDGMPLAIELAASRASILAIEDIAARLDDQMRLLRQVPVTRERRHRSLEAVVTWSVDQLEPATRELFLLLSVFAGDFGVAGVEQVMGNFGMDPADALDQLSELSSASLLGVVRGSRYRVLEPIRQLAAAGLEATGQDVNARLAHAQWIVDLLEQGFVDNRNGAIGGFAEVDAEGEEIRAATRAIAKHGFSEFIQAFAIPGGYWFVSRDATRGTELWTEIVEICDPVEDELTYAHAVVGWCIVTASHATQPRPDDVRRAIAILDAHEHANRWMARLVAAFRAVQEGEMHNAVAYLEKASLVMGSEDEWAQAILDMSYTVVNSLAMMLNLPAPHGVDAAVRRGERAAATFRSVNDTWALGITLGELGRLKQSRGDFEGAEQALLESVELFGETELHGLHYILSEIGTIASQRGDHDAASEYHRQALELARADGGSGCIAATFVAMAASAEVEGDLARAINEYERALALDVSDELPGMPAAWEQDRDRLTKALNEATAG